MPLPRALPSVGDTWFENGLNYRCEMEFGHLVVYAYTPTAPGVDVLEVANALFALGGASQLDRTIDSNTLVKTVQGEPYTIVFSTTGATVYAGDNVTSGTAFFTRTF